MSPDDGQPPEKADQKAPKRKNAGSSTKLYGRSLCVSAPPRGPLAGGIGAVLVMAPGSLLIGWLMWPGLGWLVAAVAFIAGMVSGAREVDDVYQVDFEEDGYVMHSGHRSWTLPLSALREVTVVGTLFGDVPRSDEFTTSVSVRLRFYSAEIVATGWPIAGDSAAVARQIRGLLPAEGIEFRHELGWTEVSPAGDSTWVTRRLPGQ